MNKQIMPIVKINLKNIKVPYFVTCLIFLSTLGQTVIYTIIANVRDKAGNQFSISSGNYLWLLVLLSAIFIPTLNLRRIVNLGGKRNGFFWGCMTAYTVLAGAASLINTVYYYTFERFLINTGYYVSFETFKGNTSLLNNYYINVNLIELFGWNSNGIFFVFMQQFAFLLLLAAVIHTLAAMQDKWYGWVTDILIATILATFIPISVLRPTLLSFINLILYSPNAFLQIAVCMIFAVVVYALSKPILLRKTI